MIIRQMHSFLRKRKAFAADFIDPGHDHKSIGIDLCNKPVQLRKLPVRYHCHDHILLFSQISGCRMDQSGATVHLPVDRRVDLLRFPADDLHLSLRTPEYQYLIQHDRVGHDQEDSIEDCLFI